MNFTLNGLITPTSITFMDQTGNPYSITNAHVNFERIKTKFKEITQFVKTGCIQHIMYVGEDAKNEQLAILMNELINLTDVSTTINERGKGKIFVKDGTVWYADREIHNTITQRIVDGLNEGFDMNPYILFLENLLQNPSETAVNELYDFMEYGRMGITDDGYLIAYKKVRNNYTDVHSGKFDNSPGQSHSMARDRVDPDRNRTCSNGFHFCSFDYLSQFGGQRVVLVKINPRDVVAVPADYNNTKARCSAYTVLSELENYSENTLTNRSVWTNTNIHNTEEATNVYYEDASESNDWAEVESDTEEVVIEDYALEDAPEVLTEEYIELVEYFVDFNGSTTKVRVHVVRDEEVYATEDSDLIARVFEYIKSKFKLTGEKQLVKIVRI